MREDLDTLKARGQGTLIEFLHTDLDVAFTFLQTARIEAGSNADHCKAALDRAWTALASLRALQGHVEDPSERDKIHHRANELEGAIKDLLTRRLEVEFPPMHVKHSYYYVVLGVPRGCNRAEIRTAYRKLARQHHAV